MSGDKKFTGQDPTGKEGKMSNDNNLDERGLRNPVQFCPLPVHYKFFT